MLRNDEQEKKTVLFFNIFIFIVVSCPQNAVRSENISHHFLN